MRRGWPGLTWPVLAWLGLAWLGLARPGLAWLGLAWLGLAWPGLAWLGLYWPDLVSFLNRTERGGGTLSPRKGVRFFKYSGYLQANLVGDRS